MKVIIKIMVIVFLISATQCERKKSTTSSTTKENETYTMNDFKSVRKIDTHVHITSEDKTIMKFARANNFRLLDISVDASVFPSIEKQVAIKEKHYNEEPDLMAFSTAFTLTEWDSQDWVGNVINQLSIDFKKGANSVKIWKNIGMEAKDKDGNLIMIDDPKFDSIFQFIKNQGKVLISHAGEPKNCWLPLDSMTVKNDYDYFKAQPQYHMYLYPDMPSYENQITARNNMLSKNPDIPFVAVHMGSLEWNVEEAAKFLDRFPNASLDLAARVSHTQYQSQKEYEKVHDFFIKYQDRILYGTDFIQDKETVRETYEKNMQETWLNDWKYFNTNELVTVPQLDTPVQGLALPKHVINKIYRLNAERIFTYAWQ